jgi:hypothetical protein
VVRGAATAAAAAVVVVQKVVAAVQPAAAAVVAGMREEGRELWSAQNTLFLHCRNQCCSLLGYDCLQLQLLLAMCSYRAPVSQL